MTLEEMKQVLHRLQLDVDPASNLIYLYYRRPDGIVHQFSISLRSAVDAKGREMSVDQLLAVMNDYPDAKGATLMAVEHPTRGLTRWIDAVDVCHRLHTSRQTLRRWVQRGMLHPSRLGNRLYFDPEEVERLLRSNIIQPNGRVDRVGRRLERDKHELEPC